MGDPQAFVSMVALGAQEFQIQTGVFASVTIAQAILETGYGRFRPVDKHTGQESFNLFGIKGTGPAGSVLADTREVLAGRSVMVEAHFRAYHDYGESIADHGAVLLQERYRPVRQAPTPEDACLALYQCGYATDAPANVDGDPAYHEKLIELIRAHNLKRFDLTGGEVVVVKAFRELAGRVTLLERTLVSGDDQAVSSWAIAAVERLKAAGIVGFDVDGDQAPDFCPKKPVTREELAEILRRLGLLALQKGE